jgi:hypothetical protein
MGWNREQALEGLRSHDLIGIGMEADALRRRLHPEGVVSYVIERTVPCGFGAGPDESPDALHTLLTEAESRSRPRTRLV